MTNTSNDALGDEQNDAVASATNELTNNIADNGVTDMTNDAAHSTSTTADNNAAVSSAANNTPVEASDNASAPSNSSSQADPVPDEAQPLVSIIVPVYNAADYLDRCIDSILDQSHTNLEVILIDDGSTDGSAKVCDEYADLDSRVTVIHQPNGGIGKAQNAGLDAAHGRYIAFSDNDDILDRRNIELLLHALVTTGADMSKARWRQFGVSQIEDVAHEAEQGAPDPGKITVFSHPLHAYQTVFCKSLRILGDALGHNTEAKYFNEANWCRLYRRELWDGIRFPEGVYAQDTAVACRLYTRMGKVADIDVNLYNWLQRADSVTHKMRSASFYHDHVAASLHNMRLCKDEHVLPARSYYTLVSNNRYEQKAAQSEQATGKSDDGANTLAVATSDNTQTGEILKSLSPIQRFTCMALRAIRLAEKFVYDRKIKNMK
ncbi:glycosyltransferase family 2 protein [Bifidobacterium sp. ESL0790]|uniref:glycosyltransferase family 2 protein n=1 Tax=Bifidobacterium sp. ESL0790 TaxID=2983233 RepID=UPI0023F70D48|nr:glycosyltransferase family 2 protein [Bifidobacterium sp. ESL0790]WEV72332.1 glycosyltransferase family 2 protein [Bifidobacterium sp. ESL0790]